MAATAARRAASMFYSVPRSHTLKGYTTISTPSETDIRSQLLSAALKYVPEYGFSIRALQAAASSLPARKSLSSSPLTIEQLFPSRSVHSFPQIPTYPRTRNKKGKSPQKEGDLVDEPIGPIRALFAAWAADQRDNLRTRDPGTAKGSVGLTDLLETRLGLNIPVLPHLPKVFATLSKPDQPSLHLLSLKSYLQHVQDIALDIQEITRAETSLLRLATAYTLAEAYQIGPSKPTFEQTKKFADRVLASTGRLDGAVKDSFQFAGYVADSWKNIFKSYGL
ncbi:MAG: hypothetical protein CYPHOPRED_001760 [Cyphobasidiales sp. Tagirdzhanova-0007]|nr:MAG: hypothetical protein CYPHOPRED_001760 [Cyphobasidiales sp. Tagirdzhanova-0007]